MIEYKTLIFSLFLSLVTCFNFRPEFKFGAATSSYQVEGSSNISESIWHRFSHVPGKISDGSTGDVACDSYTKWKEDIQLAKDVGLDYYRFSISWPRLLPTAFPDHISEDGKKYYNDLIDGLLENGIQPLITIYHWDLPQRIQDLGGWTNPLITDWYADYARVVYSLFGDRVKTFLTINEPTAFCELTYNAGLLAPGIKVPQYGTFLCIKNALVAHAKAWRIYDKEFRTKYHGKVSYTDVALWVEPLNEESEEDIELADLANHYGTGLYTHPVFSKNGGWPPLIEEKISEYSKKKGFTRSVLPAFTQEEIELVKGTYDFLGFNYYVSRAARSPAPGEQVDDCMITGIPALHAVITARPEWQAGANHGWFTMYPEGLRKQLNWFKQQYGDIEYWVMENGYPDEDPTLEDVDRIKFLKDHMEQILLAIEDGVNVVGFTVWTLFDNFEWMDGYKTKFGLYNVDFDSANLTRTPRASARFYSDIIRTRSLDIFVDYKISKDEL